MRIFPFFSSSEAGKKWKLWGNMLSFEFFFKNVGTFTIEKKKKKGEMFLVCDPNIYLHSAKKKTSPWDIIFVFFPWIALCFILPIAPSDFVSNMGTKWGKGTHCYFLFGCDKKYEEKKMYRLKVNFKFWKFYV